MIKSLNVVTSMGQNKFAITVKWKDPANLLTWEDLASKFEDSMNRFQTRMKLKPRQGFELHELPDFLIKDKSLGACHAQIMDLNRGTGIEMEETPSIRVPQDG